MNLKSPNHCLIIGYGVTGQSIVNYFHHQGWQCTIYDDNADHLASSTLKGSMQLTNAIEKLSPLKSYEHIFISPGIADDHPLLQKMNALAIQGISDIEYFLNHTEGKIITITGSNGKSTITRWLEYVLNKNGKKTIAVGNIGKPVLDHLNTSGENAQHPSKVDYWIIEISSFQIQITPSLRANMATVTNISADHIDRHHSLEQYIKVKQKLLEVSEHCLINRDDPESYLPPNHSQSQSMIAWGNSPSYGLNEPLREEDYGLQDNSLMRGKTHLLEVDQLPLIGKHNVLNALVVWMFAQQCGLNDKQIATTITQWQGLEHRFQVIHQENNITWINDSKSTNVGSMEVAIKSCMQLCDTPIKNIFLIVGGQGKSADFTSLIPLLKQQIKEILLFGQDAKRIAQDWQDNALSLMHFSTLDEIVRYCFQKANHGDFILFSPGCASFDQFENYQQRGRIFVQLVKNFQR